MKVALLTNLRSRRSPKNTTRPQVRSSFPGVSRDHDLVILPKSVNAKRIAENVGIFDYDAEDTAAIDGINLNLRYNDASTDFGYVFFSDEKSPAKIADAFLELSKSAVAKAKATWLIATNARPNEPPWVSITCPVQSRTRPSRSDRHAHLALPIS
ncbi:hypothetical protein AG1IA_09846 [Rhizoctonia solani AG-1 IA]|uniref:Uncharacterized protein n=1 Tax=Thanatephorus cucumeris (strain AG1-IA) TaxID=983506 RepID=L8WID9_THACA|nr:hypothetical protein AG1IA_09846 [Rhizoctonia solani AG-1 IA]